MDRTRVLVVGAGPVGMMLAAELALAGAPVTVLERRATPVLEGSRAGGLHARSIEVLDMRGQAQRFIAAGRVAQVTSFAGIALDLSDAPSRYPHGLALWQSRIEALMADWLADLGVEVRRGVTVTGYTADAPGAVVQTEAHGSFSARFVVACDGGRSLLRKAAGIGFPGQPATVSHILGEVRLTETPVWGMKADAPGLTGLSLLDDGVTVRAMVTEAAPGARGEPSLEELRAGLIAAYGTDYGLHSPRWLTRFTDAARQAEVYRKGPLLLAGDAAHVHYPAGGQGLNLGLQDAVNLGWKLALVVKGLAPDSLLDSYHAERHPIGARVLAGTLAQVAAMRRDPQAEALRGVLTGVLAMDEPRRALAARMSGLDIAYDLGGDHPLVGRRMPDLDLLGGGRVHDLMHRGQALLLTFAGAPVDPGPWAGRLVARTVASRDAWRLPVLGAVPAPDAVFIRPDGHVAWVGQGSTQGLQAALERWLGPA